MDRHHIIFVFLVVLLTQCSNHMARCVITDVQLVGGPTPDRGTIEIRIDNGTWETTCGVNLGIGDVIVICRQLGFTGANRAITDTPYGQNSTPTRGLNCNGYETDLSECGLFSSACSDTGGASCHGEGYLGCFRDQPDDHDRALPGDSLTDVPDMIISYCIQFCVESTTASYTYAGVEHGTDCYCGEADARYSRRGEIANDFCQTPCSGDPTESCGGIGFISVFTTLTPPASELTSPNQVTITNYRNKPVTSSPSTTSIAPQTTPAFPLTENNADVASTLAVGILLAFVTLYGIIITLMYIHLRRSKIALKPSVSDREGQELDPYTSLDATSMKQPAYEDIKATRHGNRGHTNAIEGVEYGNQRIVEQTASVKKSNLGVANENTEPDYELPIE